MKRDDIQFPERHAPLREDIHALGGMLGEILHEQGGDSLLQLVEGDRIAAIRRREGGPDAGVEELAVRVRRRPPGLARDLVRAFSSWFQVVNVAERVHRIRRRRDYFRAKADRPQPGGVVDALAEAQGPGSHAGRYLARCWPGSASSRCCWRTRPSRRAAPASGASTRIADLLLERSNPLLAPYERARLLERIRAEITTDWQTAEHPRERLTVADEREHAVFYLAEVLYTIVPAFYEEIATAWTQLYGGRRIDAGAAGHRALWHLGRRRHGWHAGRARQEHPRDAGAPAAGDHQRLLRRVPAAGGSAVAEREPRQHRAELARRIEEYRTLLPGARHRAGAPRSHALPRVPRPGRRAAAPHL